MKLRQIAVAAIALTASFACHAAFIRTGPMQATVCSGLVIKSCDQYVVTAIGKGDMLYEPAESFPSVDEYRGSKCSIRTSSSNVITSAIKSASGPTFYTVRGGERIAIRPDYISFNCFKQ